MKSVEEVEVATTSRFENKKLIFLFVELLFQWTEKNVLVHLKSKLSSISKSKQQKQQKRPSGYL